MYFTSQQVRDVLARYGYLGHTAPWQAQNSNTGYVESQLEFWRIALTLDGGALLDGLGLTARANSEIARYTYFKANNEFPH